MLGVTMATSTVEAINSFQRDDMSLRARKVRAGAKARRPIARRPDMLAPTPERLAKRDAIAKTAAGFYRAPAPIERLRDRQQLAPTDAQLNEVMFQASEKLAGLYRAAELDGLQAIDLTRIGTGGSDANVGMATTERAAHCRREFRIATTMMGWHALYPHRGAGRLTVAVVCEEMGVKDAAAIYRPGGSNAAQLGAGMDVLREGLFALALHWRLTRG